MIQPKDVTEADRVRIREAQSKSVAYDTALFGGLSLAGSIQLWMGIAARWDGDGRGPECDYGYGTHEAAAPKGAEHSSEYAIEDEQQYDDSDVCGMGCMDLARPWRWRASRHAADILPWLELVIEPQDGPS